MELDDVELQLMWESLVAERDRVNAVIEEMVRNEVPRPLWYRERQRRLQALVFRVFVEVKRRNAEPVDSNAEQS